VLDTTHAVAKEAIQVSHIGYAKKEVYLHDCKLDNEALQDFVRCIRLLQD